jgi:hypothetical protein
LLKSDRQKTGFNMAFFTSEKPADAPVSLRDAAPKWAAISDKLTELCAREDELVGKIKHLLEALNIAGKLHSFDLGAAAPMKEPARVQASPAAATLLGELTPAPKDIPAFVAPVPAEVAELRELSAELNAVREAIDLLRSPQKGERHSHWTQAHLEGSKQYCVAIESEYSAVASGYLDALVAFGRATVDYNRFLEQRLTSVAYEFLRPIQISAGLGDPLDRQSEIRRLLAWAAECGHFDLKNIPDDWKRR